MEPEKAYEEIHVDERGGNKFSNISPVIWIVLLIIGVIIVYGLQSGIGGASFKTYLPYIVLIVLVVILILMNSKSGKVLMTRREAEILVYKELEDDEKIRKAYPRELPEGKRLLGMVKLIYNKENEPVYWNVGFSIRGYLGSNYPRWFKAEVDPWRNGIGIITIEKLESEYKGEAPYEN